MADSLFYSRITHRAQSSSKPSGKGELRPVMTAIVTLTLVQGQLDTTDFEFSERTTCVIGRGEDCSPRLPDDPSHRTVSRHHCLLDINPPRIRIRDLGSRNGTYVNGTNIGQRANGRTPEGIDTLPFPEHDLGDGDEIRIGANVFRVGVRGAVPPPPALEDPAIVAQRQIGRASCRERVSVKV